VDVRANSVQRAPGAYSHSEAIVVVADAVILPQGGCDLFSTKRVSVLSIEKAKNTVGESE
jgi:hypothetical protein